MPSSRPAPGSERTSEALQRATTWLLAGFLVLAWFGGGPTVDVGATDEWLMLLALPVLLVASAGLLQHPPASRQLRIALALAFALLLIPLLQLLVVPEQAWRGAGAREAVALDLAAAGVQARHAWSLWPETTERALYALLPGLACFLGAVYVGTRGRRRLVPIALALVLANLAFGFFQVDLPLTSPMRLYTNNGTGFGGVLVNGNHQGTALIVGMLLALGLWARQRRRVREGAPAEPMKNAAYATAALVCLASVPLAGSSAAMLIACPVFAGGLLATGLVDLKRMRRSRRGAAAGVGVLAVLVIGLVAASGWLNLKRVDADRYDLARDVAAAGLAHAPLGSGAGTFVDSFAQSRSASLARSEYVNHAHNEYAQWWFEAGWPGMALLLAALALFIASGWRLLRARPRDPVAIACWLAVAAVLAHSWVDFPLRTLSLMSMSGLLMGFLLAASAEHATRRAGTRARVDVPEGPQPA
jgi:O-antigen ligase